MEGNPERRLPILQREEQQLGIILFCNIGWMRRYEGNKDRPDKIVCGGSWVKENGTGHEVCNFMGCPDGFVYGHVETIKKHRDRKIVIENLGGSGNYVDGIDVVWTATDPEKRGRRIVGWYRNATVFRERQYFDKAPTEQHHRDGINNYRIRARIEDVHCVDPKDRTLQMGRGCGWMGQTPWKVLSELSSPEIREFLWQAQRLLGVDTSGSNLSMDVEYQEGDLKVRQHLQRERYPGLADKKKTAFIESHGKLYCERCGLDPVSAYGAEYGFAVIEVHHAATMVREMGEKHRTKLEDLQCLCANCHRLTHAKLKR